MENFFSGADLVKKSATQIKYLRDKKISYITKRMEQGIKFQKQIAEQKDEACEEFRSTFVKEDIVIFACHDIITPSKIIEVKTTEFGKQNWYLQSSLVQTALYKSIIMLSDGFVCTPKFRIKEGYKKECKTIDKKLPYYLQFGKDEYKIDVLNPEYILNYFVNKAKVTLQDYSDCRTYDYEHKWKTFEELKDYFTFSYE